ncbi:hypothetical protein PMIN01_02886 [Paraphaeosphaeria minitans]|uniref:Uncharacterized protein n=1 Tax=Paraphaeosphaeria minitans TaxID=565426 RepID=A0A9P6GRW2_9PLEO|nr:hypothetical protein PMIN01_02886 [Paraphaeosphaeria minitans]
MFRSSNPPPQPSPTVPNLPPTLQRIAPRPTLALVNVRLAHPIPAGTIAALRDALAAGESPAAVTVACGELGGAVDERGIGAGDEVAWEEGDDIVRRVGGRDGGGKSQGGEEQGEEGGGEVHFGQLV